MASVTIRRIDDDTKDWLRRRAGATGRSVEGEIRELIAREKRRDDPSAYPPGMAPRPDEPFGSYLYRISRPGFEIAFPERWIEPMRDPFGDPD
ncbi:hypothetical protein IP88_05140 [alpha proteobacterium AAP81b]|nr:hypothetical protein IP88_05140 [alpha proteobacterium AAP81b]